MLRETSELKQGLRVFKETSQSYYEKRIGRNVLQLEEYHCLVANIDITKKGDSEK